MAAPKTVVRATNAVRPTKKTKSISTFESPIIGEYKSVIGHKAIAVS